MLGTSTGPILGGAGFDTVNRVAKNTGWLHPFATAFANYGVVAFAVCLIAGWALARRAADSRVMARALLAGAGVLAAVAINQVLVKSIAETRPYTTKPAALVLVSRSSDPSFPSDHAVMAGAAAAGVWFVNRRLGLITALLAVLMAADRVYVGAHYPIDVIAGLCVGSLTALLVTLAAQTPITALVARLRTGPIRMLLADAGG
jgi:undecaprenyl-diphosphatase